MAGYLHRYLSIQILLRAITGKWWKFSTPLKFPWAIHQNSKCSEHLWRVAHSLMECSLTANVLCVKCNFLSVELFMYKEEEWIWKKADPLRWLKKKDFWWLSIKIIMYLFLSQESSGQIKGVVTSSLMTHSIISMLGQFCGHRLWTTFTALSQVHVATLSYLVH